MGILESGDEALGGERDHDKKIAVSEGLAVLLGRTDVYARQRTAHEASVEVGLTTNFTPNRTLDCLAGLRDQLTAVAEGLDSDSGTLSVRGIDFRAVAPNFRTVNDEWDTHSDAMYTVADATSSLVTLSFEDPGGHAIGIIGFSPDFPREIRSREYGLMATHAEHQVDVA